MTYTSGQQTTSFSYSGTVDGYGGGLAMVSGPATVTCDNEIVVRYRWVSDDGGVYDTPPRWVLVRQTCSASASSTDGATAVEADNGLGFTAVASSTASGEYRLTSSGTRYQIMYGDDEIEVHASPRASASLAGGGGGVTPTPDSAAAAGVLSFVRALLGLADTGAASVYYTVAVSPVTVEYSSATGIGPSFLKRYLIGQQAQASLQAGLLTASSWSWTVTGGRPFLSYSATDSLAQLVDLGTPSNSTLQCYFAQPDSSPTAFCTAHLDVPAGAHPAEGLDVTAWRSCHSEAPQWEESAGVGTTQQEADLFWLAGASVTAGQMTWSGPGFLWPCCVTTPTDYVASQDTGTWLFAQLFWPRRLKTLDNGRHIGFSLNDPADPYCDKAFPYGRLESDPCGPFDANTVWHAGQDSPAELLSCPFPERTTIAASAADRMRTYLLYLPPGLHSTYVPLRYCEWTWGGSDVLDANGWVLTPTTPTLTRSGAYPPHPQWTAVCTGSEDWVYTD